MSAGQVMGRTWIFEPVAARGLVNGRARSEGVGGI